MAELNVSFTTYWERQETDLSKCAFCKETIYSEMNLGKILITNKDNNESFKGNNNTFMILCNSCYDVIKN